MDPVETRAVLAAEDVRGNQGILRTGEPPGFAGASGMRMAMVRLTYGSRRWFLGLVTLLLFLLGLYQTATLPIAAGLPLPGMSS